MLYINYISIKNILEKRKPSPGQWLSWLEHCPINLKVMGLTLSQGTYLGYSFSPQSGHMQGATDQCFSLTLMFLSRSLTFPSPRSINEYVLR